MDRRRFLGSLLALPAVAKLDPHPSAKLEPLPASPCRDAAPAYTFSTSSCGWFSANLYGQTIYVPVYDGKPL